MPHRITYVLTTYERPRFLEQALSFYANTSMNIIVCDGSAKSNQERVAKVGHPSIRYFHMPGVDPWDRIFYGLSLVTTPFIKWLTDDDLYIEKGVLDCVNFLESNPSYVSAWGATLGFEQHNPRIDYYMQEPYLYDFDVNAEDSFSRVLQFWSRASYDIQHGVHRTSTYISNLRLSFSAPGIGVIENGNIHERMLLSIFPASGKLKWLNVPFGLRETQATNLGRQSIPIADMLRDPSRRTQVETFLRIIAKLGELYPSEACPNPVEFATQTLQALIHWEVEIIHSVFQRPKLFSSLWGGGQLQPDFTFEPKLDVRFAIYNQEFFQSLRRLEFHLRSFAIWDQAEMKRFDLECDRVEEQFGQGKTAEPCTSLGRMYNRNPFHRRTLKIIADRMKINGDCEQHIVILDWLEAIERLVK